MNPESGHHKPNKGYKEMILDSLLHPGSPLLHVGAETDVWAAPP